MHDESDNDAWRGSPEETKAKLEVIRKIWCGEITVEEGQRQLQEIVGEGYEVQIMQTRQRIEPRDG